MYGKHKRYKSVLKMRIELLLHQEMELDWSVKTNYTQFGRRVQRSEDARVNLDTKMLWVGKPKF